MSWKSSTPPDVRKMVDEVSAIIGKRPNYSERSKEGRSYKWTYVGGSERAKVLIGKIRTICEGYTDMYATIAYVDNRQTHYGQFTCSGIRILCKGIA